MQIKQKLFEVLESPDPADKASKFTDIFLVTLILLNVAVVVFETVEAIQQEYHESFALFDSFSVAVFTLEYILRVWVCTLDKRFKGKLKGRAKYALTPIALIDLIAILPFYLPFVFTFDLRLMRLIRLARLLRLLKVIRYSESLKIFTDVYRLKRQELTMVFLSILFLLVISSALIYHVEHEAQPEAFANIPAAMWWSVATLTTVGYGDVYPITRLGKFLGAIIALIGIGIFALPAAILGSGFITVMRRKSGGAFLCPHCHKAIQRHTQELTSLKPIDRSGPLQPAAPPIPKVPPVGKLHTEESPDGDTPTES